MATICGCGWTQPRDRAWCTTRKQNPSIRHRFEAWFTNAKRVFCQPTCRTREIVPTRKKSCSRLSVVESRVLFQIPEKYQKSYYLKTQKGQEITIKRSLQYYYENIAKSRRTTGNYYQLHDFVIRGGLQFSKAGTYHWIDKTYTKYDFILVPSDCTFSTSIATTLERGLIKIGLFALPNPLPPPLRIISRELSSDSNDVIEVWKKGGRKRPRCKARFCIQCNAVVWLLGFLVPVICLPMLF